MYKPRRSFIHSTHIFYTSQSLPVTTPWRASLAAQAVKNPPAMRETWARSLGWEDPLEEGLATHSSILAQRILMNRGAHEVAESDMTEHTHACVHTHTDIEVQEADKGILSGIRKIWQNNDVGQSYLTCKKCFREYSKTVPTAVAIEQISSLRLTLFKNIMY